MITKQVRSSVALLEVNGHIQAPSARIWIYLKPQLFLSLWIRPQGPEEFRMNK